MSKFIHPTSIADVNTVLNSFHERISGLMGNNFVGMYVIGSLALGDFNPQKSDIDFIVVTTTDISDDVFQELQQLHAQFAASSSPWATKIEAVYIPQHALNNDNLHITHYPQLEKGTELFKAPVEDGWVFQCYTLREQSLIVAGLHPRTFMNATNVLDMRNAVAKITGLWLEQAHNDPSWLDWVRERQWQVFVVLTLCRLLYSLATGKVASKPAAAKWGETHLSHQWKMLIQSSLAQQNTTGEILQSELDDTIAFIRYTFERSQANKRCTVMSEKRKNQHTLPNRQLARIFSFSAQDLAANRAGFMSRAQKWGIPLWIRRIFANIGTGIIFRKSHRPSVSRICGRAKLEYVQQQIYSHFHTDIHEYHFLHIGSTRFLLNAQQHRAIAEGVLYHVYYTPETKQILSLERAINGCNETQ